MNNRPPAQIFLVPFKHIESVLLNYLHNEINDLFKAEVVFVNKETLPQAAYNQYRDQYRTNAFLDALASMNKKGKVIGICDVDIYAPNTNYVFSVADFTKQVAIISITRLKPIYYKMYQDESVFWGRVLKETIHSLGRLYGLEHCFRQECVMHLSSSIIQIDIKSNRFCGDCRRLLVIDC